MLRYLQNFCFSVCNWVIKFGSFSGTDHRVERTKLLIPVLTMCRLLTIYSGNCFECVNSAFLMLFTFSDISSVLQIEDLQFITIPIVGLGIVIRYGKIYFATFPKDTTLLRDFFLLRYFPLLRYHPLSRIYPLLKDYPLWRLFLS